jgi:hypothetical protein
MRAVQAAQLHDASSFVWSVVQAQTNHEPESPMNIMGNPFQQELLFTQKNDSGKELDIRVPNSAESQPAPPASPARAPSNRWFYSSSIPHICRNRGASFEGLFGTHECTGGFAVSKMSDLKY